MTKKKEKGQLIVLSGPSGVGKSTVIAELLGQRKGIYFSVSYTTRQPRVGEADGINYNFVSRTEFERMIADQELLEYAEYVNNYYGTSLKMIQEKLNAGIDVLLDIFIIPPSFEELSRRLHNRNTDNEDVIAGRLEKAKIEFREIPTYDYLVINDKVSNAVEEIEAILVANECRVDNRRNILKGEFSL